MMEFDTPDIQNLFEKTRAFSKMYEIIRFVDPLRKKVIDYKKSNFIKGDSSCFDFWDKGGMCENCISMRAYNENETFVKLEFNHNGLYMVTAVPVVLDDRTIIVELLKDVTNSMVLDSKDNGNDSGVHSIITNLNSIMFKDPLTGIYNRRYIDERLPVDLINASVQNQGLSVIIADLDYFKNVNDTYGHLAGDQVLIKFAKSIDDSIRKGSDWVARFGGEEFLVCLPNAGSNKAFEIAERMRKNLEGMDIEFGDNIINVRASFGVYCIEPGIYMSSEEIIKNADRNLYCAKHLGRNRVVA